MSGQSPGMPEDPAEALRAIVNLELKKYWGKANAEPLMDAKEIQNLETLSRVLYKAPEQKPPPDDSEAGAVRALAQALKTGA